MIIIVSVDTENLPKVLNEIRKAHPAGNWYDYVEILPETPPLQLSAKFLHLWADQKHAEAVREQRLKEKS